MLSKLFKSPNYDTKFISYIIVSYLAPIDKNKITDVFPKFNIYHKICSESSYINNFLLNQPSGFIELINTINKNYANCHITGGCALKLYTGSNWDGDIDMEIITDNPTDFLLLLKKNHFQFHGETKCEMMSRVKNWYVEDYNIEYYQGEIDRKDFHLVKIFITDQNNESKFKVDVWIHNGKSIINTFDLSCCKIRTSKLSYPTKDYPNPPNQLIIDESNKNLLDNNSYNLCEYLIKNILYFVDKIENNKCNDVKYITLQQYDSCLINSLIKSFKRINKYNSRGFELINKDKYLINWCKELFTKIGLDIDSNNNIIEIKSYKIQSGIEMIKYVI